MDLFEKIARDAIFDEAVDEENFIKLKMLIVFIKELNEFFESPQEGLSHITISRQMQEILSLCAELNLL